MVHTGVDHIECERMHYSTSAMFGFVAGPEQSRDNPLGRRGLELHAWHLGDPRATDADETAISWLMRPRGAYVMGRNMFGPARRVHRSPRSHYWIEAGKRA